MSNLQRAIEIAVEAHKDQVQKSGLPYILHPLALMGAVTSVDAKIAAVLHDVVEDTAWSLDDLRAEGFSTEVLAAIDCLTHREGEAYEDYLSRVAGNDLARAVKLADLKDNMNFRRIPELKQKDLDRLAKYHRAWFLLGGELE